MAEAKIDVKTSDIQKGMEVCAVSLADGLKKGMWGLGIGICIGLTALAAGTFFARQKQAWPTASEYLMICVKNHIVFFFYVFIGRCILSNTMSRSRPPVRGNSNGQTNLTVRAQSAEPDFSP